MFRFASPLAHPTRRSIAVVLLVLLAGCKGWRAETVPLPEYLASEKPEVVLITRQDNTRTRVYDPEIVGRDLRGLPTERSVAGISIPLSDVRSVSSRRFSLGRTLLISLGVVGGVIVYELLQSLNQTPIQ